MIDQDHVHMIVIDPLTLHHMEKRKKGNQVLALILLIEKRNIDEGHMDCTLKIVDIIAYIIFGVVTG